MRPAPPDARPPARSSKMGFALVGIACLAAATLIFVNRPSKAMPAHAKADFLLVEKSAHRLTAYHHGAPLASYPVALGRGPVGPKVREGDNRTPEGRYTIDRHNPASAFYLALHVSYPSATAARQAEQAGFK